MKTHLSWIRVALPLLVCGFPACAPSGKPAADGAAAHGNASVLREMDGGWFKGMIHPPKVTPALPADFILVSASPETKASGEFDMYRGVIWAPARTARRFEFGKMTQLDQVDDPLFAVRLSSSVGQYAGTDDFSDEDKLLAQCSMIGLKNLKTAKTRWGSYPVMSVTGERPDGSAFAMAWIGINSPDGWTIFVDYRTPKGPGHPTQEERQIWERFLSESK